MNTRKITALIAIAIVAVALTTASAIAFIGLPETATTATTYTKYPNDMMNGYYPSTSTVPPQGITTEPTTIPPAPTTTTATTQNTTKELTINDAATAAQNYLLTLGNPNLGIKTVQEYTSTYNAQVIEKDTGAGAFELAIDKYTGAVTPMPGPTLMWDTKYGTTADGMMGYLTTGETRYNYGMMGGYGGMMNWLRGTPTITMQVTTQQATTIAQQYLNTNYPGTTVGNAATYYGYYAMQVQSGGNIIGMMGINGATGQVIYYTWCGTFMQQILLG